MRPPKVEEEREEGSDETSYGKNQSHKHAADPEWDPIDNADDPGLRHNMFFGVVSVYTSGFC